jgi:1,2-diacylglycerol 3-alpha-glucosyltransferase
MINQGIAILWVHFGPYHVARLAALRSRCCNVTAIQFAQSQEKYGWSMEGGPDLISLSSAAHERTSFYRRFRSLWRVLNARRPRILMIPGYHEPLALVAALWGHLHGGLNILMSDSTFCDRPRSSWKERPKGFLASSLFNAAFVSGGRAVSYLRSLGYRAASLETGYDVVDNNYFETRVAQIRNEGATPQQYPFLFVGRFDPVKNLHLLIESFGAYRKDGGQRNLKMVGTGPLDREIRGIVAKRGLSEAIHFAGYQNYAQLPAHYARAHCLILPSLSEPWGLVVNEAMASGLPVIVSDRCGCADELVDHGNNGFVFPAEDGSVLVDCLHRMDSLTREQWEATGLCSRRIVASFSPQSWAEAVSRLVDRCLEEGARCTAAA